MGKMQLLTVKHADKWATIELQNSVFILKTELLHDFLAHAMECAY